MSIDFGRVHQRFLASVGDHLDIFENDPEGVGAGLLESPIEALFAQSLYFVLTQTCGHRRDIFKFRHPDQRDDPIEGPAYVVVPQYPFRNFRIDFALWHTNAPEMRLFIECDGHDFHERTKEQAARDRSRDRSVLWDGHSVLRFTGSELWADPVGAAGEVVDFLHEQLRLRLP